MAEAPNFWCHKCSAPVHLANPDQDFSCPNCTDSFLETYTPPEEDPPEFRRAQAFAESPLGALFSGAGEARREPGGLLGAMLRLAIDPGQGEEDEDGNSRERRLMNHGRAIQQMLEQLRQLAEMRGMEHEDQAPEDLYENMPDVTIAEGDEPCGRECPVCQETFVQGDECKQLPCSHVFHNDCIQPWLQMKTTCPLCRHECA
eukprot:TRINITY_DN8188_c0_g1_i3.p1 TRINITY_DN8188_c0_g1~~TRINITY_DN8188_c0_g1_i3.p1  ORF type:complete len:202 (+),score=25.94 TRINITY_DN8188_c0_g1_i3:159-764(+)